MAEEIREHPIDVPVKLPGDVVAAAAFEPDAESKVVPADAVPEGWLGLDIGPETREGYAKRIAMAKTVFWNGPMGVFEWPRFAEGTQRGRARRRRGGRAHGRRRRRLGAGGRGGRARRPDRLGLDRRRRVARAARGQGAARRGGDPGRMTQAQVQKRRKAPMLIAGNWKMYKGPAEAAEFCRALRERLGGARRRRRRGLPAVPLARPPPCRRWPGTEIAVAAQNVHWEEQGAFTGEVSARDAARARRLRRDRRPLRAAPATSARPTRAWPGERPRRSTPGLWVIACVGETEAGARARRDRGGARPPGIRARAARPARDRLRAGVGDRHRQDRDARAGAGGARVHPQPASTCRSCTAARSSPTTPPSCSPSRTSTARSSAAPRSRSSRSRRSSRLRRGAEADARPTCRARHPRRVGLCAAGPGQRRRPRRDARLRPALGRVPAHDAEGLGRGRRPAAGPDGQLRGRPPDDRLGADPLPGPDAREQGDRGRLVLREPRPARGVRARSRTSTCSGSSPTAASTRTSTTSARCCGFAPEKTWIHAFTDGRDVSPHSAVHDLAELPAERIATRLRPLLRDGPGRTVGADAARARRDRRFQACHRDRPCDVRATAVRRGRDGRVHRTDALRGPAGDRARRRRRSSSTSAPTGPGS